MSNNSLLSQSKQVTFPNAFLVFKGIYNYFKRGDRLLFPVNRTIFTNNVQSITYTVPYNVILL